MNANSNRADMHYELHALARRLRHSDPPTTTDIKRAATALQDYAASLTNATAAPASPGPEHSPAADRHLPEGPAIPPPASLRQVIGSTMAGFLGGFIAGYPMGLILGWFF